MSEEQNAPQAGADEANDAAETSAAEQGGSASVALMDGRGGILGVKAGMTQVFDQNGNAKAVTVIDVRPNRITQVKTNEKDGYQAVQVGLLDKKDRKMNRPEKGHVKKSGGQGFYHYQEFRLPKGASMDGLEAGKTLDLDFIKEGDLVDLSSTSKGKGFQGVIKRHNYSGGPASHGASIVHRMGGSIGQGTDPGRVFKGKKMAGQMGNKRTTVQNVKVVRVDKENNLLLVHGSVPGPQSGVVTVRRAVKRLEQQV